MELVGIRWQEGQWSISVEHLASVALNQALSRVRPSDNPEARIGPTAVLAAPEMEQHVAGLACLAQVLEDDGWHVENLGANVPANDLVAFVAARDVDLVAMSLGTADRLETLRRSGRRSQGRAGSRTAAPRRWARGCRDHGVERGEPSLPLAGRRAAIRPVVEALSRGRRSPLTACRRRPAVRPRGRASSPGRSGSPASAPWRSRLR